MSSTRPPTQRFMHTVSAVSRPLKFSPQQDSHLVTQPRQPPPPDGSGVEPPCLGTCYHLVPATSHRCPLPGAHRGYKMLTGLSVTSAPASAPASVTGQHWSHVTVPDPPTISTDQFLTLATSLGPIPPPSCHCPPLGCDLQWLVPTHGPSVLHVSAPMSPPQFHV